MKNIFILFIVIGLTGCKSEDKYQPQHGFKGKVKKVTTTEYQARTYNGTISVGEILNQSYILFDETGKKVDGHTDFSNLKTDAFWESTTTKKTEIDNYGNWTEKITYEKDGTPYSVTKKEFKYYE